MENAPTKSIWQLLLEKRVLQIFGEINDSLANQTVALLTYLDQESNDPITLEINSPGGSITAGLAIVDAIKFIKAPVHCIVFGMAASMAAVIACSCEKRRALPNSMVMIHQSRTMGGGQQGVSTIFDKRNELALSEKLNQKALQLLADGCMKTYDEIEKDTREDKWFFADEAVKYGLIDEVIQPRNKTEE